MFLLPIRVTFRIKKRQKPNLFTETQKEKTKKQKIKNGGFLRCLQGDKIFLKFFLKFRLTFQKFERILSGLSS